MCVVYSENQLAVPFTWTRAIKINKRDGWYIFPICHQGELLCKFKDNFFLIKTCRRLSINCASDDFAGLMSS
jgi:hypothetical protein